MAKTRSSLVAQPVVDDDAAARADRDARGARELVARPDAGRDDDHVRVEHLAVRELDARDRVVADDLGDALVDVDARRRGSRIVCSRSADAALVELPGHQARRDLDDVRLEARVEHGARRLEARGDRRR